METMQSKRIINWVDELLSATSMMMGMDVHLMLAMGVEIYFPRDILQTIIKTANINDDGKMIVSNGVVKISPNQNDSVKIVIAQKLVYEFG